MLSRRISSLNVVCSSCGQGSHKAVFEHPGHLEQGGGMVAEGSLVEAAEEMHLKAGDGAVSMGPFCLHVADPLLA
eukprot:COSAG04_NODE_1537_length_6425_cov_2.244546_6_plen_75_part_00